MVGEGRRHRRRDRHRRRLESRDQARHQALAGARHHRDEKEQGQPADSRQPAEQQVGLNRQTDQDRPDRAGSDATDRLDAVDRAAGAGGDVNVGRPRQQRHEGSQRAERCTEKDDVLQRVA